MVYLFLLIKIARGISYSNFLIYGFCAPLSVFWASFFAGQYYKALPHVLMVSLAVSGAVLCLLLPETYRKAFARNRVTNAADMEVSLHTGHGRLLNTVFHYQHRCSRWKG